MTVRKLSGRCHLLALAVFVPVLPAAAQTIGAPAPTSPYPSGAVVQPLPPIDPLSANLKILAQNPYDVNALTAAGIGALEVGDPQAAIGFLARAEELSPRDPRIKASLGSALAMMERPQEALMSFAGAVALGYPERMIVRDRGLAYDLLGDHKRAQKDYATAEKQAYDAEAIRRHALSLGVVGEKDQALKLLDPLVRKGDQASWRARAFVLAMNGEMPQADRIIRAATPPAALNGMMAFLRRLPSLTSAQRVSAVNFGTIPTTGPIYASAEPAEGFRSLGNGQTDGLLSGSGEQPRVQTASAPASAPRLSRAEQRRAEKRERELEKLAARGQQARGVPVATTLPPAPVPAPPARPVVLASRPAAPPPQPPAPKPAPPPEPVRTVAVSERVGKRIGPVDPERLPPEIRGAAAAEAPAPARPVQLPGARTLPPPDNVRPLPPAPAPVTVATAPVAPPPAPAPRDFVAVEPPKPAPAPVAVAAAPPVITSSPPPTPTTVITPVALPPSAPVQTAMVIPPALPKPDPAPPTASPSLVPPSVIGVIPPAPAPAPAGTAPVAPPPAQPLPTIVDSKPALPPAPSTAPVAGPPVALANPPAAAPLPGVSSPAATLPGVQPVTASLPPASPVVPKPDPAPQPGFGDMPAPSTPVVVETAAPPNRVVVEGTLPAAGAPPPPEPAKPAPPAKPENRLGSILDGIETEAESAAAPLPTQAQLRAQRLAAQRKAEAEAKSKSDKDAELKAEKEAAAKKAEEEAAKIKANPARIWVQIATGSNRSGLPVTLRKVREDAPKAMGDRGGWFVPFKATFRLLVGPVKSAGEARTLVTALSKEGVSATTWSSEAGQEVLRLGGR